MLICSPLSDDETVTLPFGAGGEQVAEADVGEGAAGHDAVVARDGCRSC